MEEMEQDPPSPFWLRSTTVRHHHRRRAASSLFLNTGVLVVFLLAAAIVFLVIVIPSVLSLARQVFNPSSVKSSWNSLNILLVVFAIVCGFLGRREGDSTTPASSPVRREVEEREYQSFGIGSDDNGGRLRRRLRRNSSSYPDLREESSVWEMREAQRENQWRFYDDTDLNNQLFNQRFERQISYRTRSQPLPIIDEDVGGGMKTIQVDTCVDTSPEVSPPSPPPEVAPPPSAAEAGDDGSKQVVEEAESDSKTVEIDTPAENLPRSNPPPEPSPPPSPMGVILPPPSPTTYLWPPPSPNSYLWPSPSPSPPPPPPPPPPRRRAQPPAVTSKQQIKEIYETIGRPGSKSYLPPPSPPPPPAIGKRLSEEKIEKSGKKRGVATKEFLVSFYHQTKRKRKQKRRSYENLDEIMEPQPPKVSIYRSKSTPEFPPPSPPRGRPPTPPPPPPPPPSVFHNLFSSKKAKSKKKVHSVSTPASTSASRPPKDKRRLAGNGSESPLIPAPPPPPAWEVAMRGDYVKSESSTNSSPRSGYSVSQDEEGSSPSNCRTPPAPAGFCASPDVNSKAEDFIATFRAKLKLEKMDSIKQKETTTGLSPLGPEPRQN